MNYKDGNWDIKMYQVDPMHLEHQSWFDLISGEKNKVVNLRDYEHLRGKTVDAFFYTSLRKWKQEQEKKLLRKKSNEKITKRLRATLTKNPVDL